MKKKEIIKETNIGSHIELSNLELLLLKSKWNKITSVIKTSHNKELELDIVHFSSFVEKLCGDVISIKESEEELFSSEELNEDSLKEILRVSTSGHIPFDGEMSDKERSERIINS